MLTEQFITSVGTPTKPPGTNVTKDAAIFIHEFQPLRTQRAVFKKSATPPNCLAVSESHIFAAQAEKAVVYVYSRAKGNQEATVPFTERITCLALALDETVLVLGTAEGRLFLWEIASGRQVSTSQAHLQAVTKVVVDPTQNFVLSASKDSTVHIWSLPSLLAFSNTGSQPLSPIQTFTSHRAEITTLEAGHSASFCNFAVSASKDRTCFVWDYYTNATLRTYLLPAVPTCCVLDAADRAVYMGYEDGSVQQLDLFAFSDGIDRSDMLGSAAPVQSPDSTRWRLTDNTAGAVLSLSLSFDSCSLLSGHESGSILIWDIVKGGPPTSLLQNPLPGPVTNLLFLPVNGFVKESHRKLKVHNVAKPKFGAFDTLNGSVPGNYVLNVEFSQNLPTSQRSAFEKALMAPSFPASMVDEGLSELLAWRNGSHRSHGEEPGEAEDFMALDDSPNQPRELSLEERNAALHAELEALRRLQRASFEKIDRINTEKKALLDREEKRLRQKSGDRDVKMNGLNLDDDSSSDG